MRTERYATTERACYLEPYAAPDIEVTTEMFKLINASATETRLEMERLRGEVAASCAYTFDEARRDTIALREELR